MTHAVLGVIGHRSADMQGMMFGGIHATAGVVVIDAPAGEVAFVGECQRPRRASEDAVSQYAAGEGVVSHDTPKELGCVGVQAADDRHDGVLFGSGDAIGSGERSQRVGLIPECLGRESDCGKENVYKNDS